MLEEDKFTIRSRGIILYDGKLLIVKHSNHGDMDDDFYTLPGGHLDFGEDPIQCIEREIVEELGVKPKIGRLLYVNTYIEKDGTQPMEFFFEIKNGEDYLNIDHLDRSHAYEIAEIKWLNVNDEVHLLPKRLIEDFKIGELMSGSVRFIK